MINVNLSAESFPELYEKIADLLHQINTSAPVPAPAPVVNPTPAPVPAPAVSAPATPAPLPVSAAPASAPVAAPMAVAPVAPLAAAPLPTAAAPTYTLEQLGRATCALSDAGRVPEIQELFAAFGVHALTELRPEQYGSYAAALRQKGVQI